MKTFLPCLGVFMLRIQASLGFLLPNPTFRKGISSYERGVDNSKIDIDRHLTFHPNSDNRLNGTNVARHSEYIELNSTVPSVLLVHWKGEDVEGYSRTFRHAEFLGALQAAMERSTSKTDYSAEIAVNFENALDYTGNSFMSQLKLTSYNEAMQYVVTRGVPVEICIAAARRCSLVHGLYLIAASTNIYEQNGKNNYDMLAQKVLENGAFRDMVNGQKDGDNTWCLRVRQFGKSDDAGKERRYSARTRSVSQEREALESLKPILKTFGGKVSLDNPVCKIYVFDGLKNGNTVLARRIVTGPRVSIMDPNTRICVTNTPLCPIAAFAMCNIASLRSHQTILDPFAGSCATLLAAAMIEPTCRSVAIEVAHDGLVNRNDIRKDFVSRGLGEPVALLHGDFNDMECRIEARASIGGHPFDLIITDPPYGIRESQKTMEQRPVDGLLQALVEDRKQGTPLLRKGGRLVVFLPCRRQEERIEDVMPATALLNAAGLRCQLMREQPLNDCLSRWLVSFECIK